MIHDTSDPNITFLGDTALLIEGPDSALTLLQQKRVWALSRELARWPEILEVADGVNNLMVVPAAHLSDIDAFTSRIHQAWHDVTPLEISGAVHSIEVTYGGKLAPHFKEVLDYLDMSVDDFVQLHTASLYTVYALGSHPGYCYLGGMNPKLTVPRRKSPILNLPGGSLSIGGIQTGISASAGPSGWNTVGHTDVSFFDHRRDPPALFSPGDQLKLEIKEILA
ncbi:5-oxoprolinase subunit PxpB [Halomonas sp.]|uniref:5-oxoprolinase subunit PxpB n=1 Tax=Halomonas sp. TaxID=1486246 RepID=UPI003A91202F